MDAVDIVNHALRYLNHYPQPIRNDTMAKTQTKVTPEYKVTVSDLPTITITAGNVKFSVTPKQADLIMRSIADKLGIAYEAPGSRIEGFNRGVNDLANQIYYSTDPSTRKGKHVMAVVNATRDKLVRR